ncbi:MAG TPA: flagellar protein export ATPase FliI [Fimbriimonadaceae bacterium]|nr:flagellar protein export ATPase FliI [Fimbriimonadaceae bacterium]
MIAPPLFEQAKRTVSSVTPMRVYGRVTQVVGLVVEANGPNGRIGDLCFIQTAEGSEIKAEVVGFRGDRVLLMPLGELSGVRAGCAVRGSGHCMRVPVGEALLGRTIDGLGEPMDSLGPIAAAAHYPIYALPPNALDRRMIERPVSTGVRAIDGVLTLGEGQRMGIFAGSGVGKSTLLGMIARNCSADVNVIALIGERGREVREFMEHDLGEEGLRRSIVVCATSEQPALVRIKAALAATAIAEYFRDQGKSVLLMMDSVTRFCMAQREVGLAIGEPPSTKGYTPSVFALLPKLMERAGNSDKGAITALYTVLVEGDDTNEPIADAARSILDGHIVLNRKLTSRGHYPPIDVLQSLSRTMPLVASYKHVTVARDLRELIAAYNDVEDLVSIGAYKPGTKPTADRAISKWDAINGFLRQDKADGSAYDTTVNALEAISEEV